MKNASDVLKLIKDKDVKFVDLRFTDTKGKMQHVTADVGCIDEETFADGFAFDGSSIAGWSNVQAMSRWTSSASSGQSIQATAVGMRRCINSHETRASARRSVEPGSPWRSQTCNTTLAPSPLTRRLPSVVLSVVGSASSVGGSKAISSPSMLIFALVQQPSGFISSIHASTIGFAASGAAFIT